MKKILTPIISAMLLSLFVSGCAMLSGDGGVCVKRINCGAFTQYTDPAGNVWEADKMFEKGSWGYQYGSSAGRGKVEVKGTEIDEVYLNELFGMAYYRISVENGSYRLKLHFAETYDGITDAGMRVFTVKAEDKEALVDFDPFKEAGCKLFTAVVKEVDVEVTDGEITLAFTEKAQNPIINGIEVYKK